MRSTITSTTGTINALIDAQPRDQGAGLEARQPVFSQVRKHASGAESEQGNRNRQKCEVVEEHDGKQPGQRQFKQQCGKAAQRHARQHRAIRGLSVVMVGVRRDVSLIAKGCREGASLTEGEWPVVSLIRSESDSVRPERARVSRSSVSPMNFWRL